VKKGEGVIGRRGGAVIEPFCEHDQVIVSGYMVSEKGSPFIRHLLGVIGCGMWDGDGMFKVWPDDQEHHRLTEDSAFNGKLWFDGNDARTEVKNVEDTEESEAI